MPAVTSEASDKPRVCVSRCLLGDRVRYDGDSRPSDIVINDMARLFELVPVCPEVEAGLGVPRPPVQLTADLLEPRMTGREDPALDVTDRLTAFCASRIAELQHMRGYILKSRSPSCGIGTTPVFVDGNMVTASSDGLFVRAVKQCYPDIAIIDEIRLQDDRQRSRFIQQVLDAHCLISA